MHLNDVTFLSGKILISGTLTIPKNNILSPCVIMVHGSGPQDRDGNISGFYVQIFKFIADYLAKNGIASLRYDKRGCGKSNGKYKTAGLSEMVEDASSGVMYLSEQTSIDTKQIYVLGHSEGAVLAPEICSKNPIVNGAIMLCTSLRSFEEDGSKNAEIINKDLDKLSGLKGKLARWLFYTKDPMGDMISFRKKIENTESKSIWVSFQRVSTKFYRDTFEYEIKKYLSQLDIPILAIGGGKDFQCLPEDTLLIKKNTHGAVETHIFDDMNHMLRNQKGEPSMLNYKTSGKEPMLDQVYIKISNWINSNK